MHVGEYHCTTECKVYLHFMETSELGAIQYDNFMSFHKIKLINIKNLLKTLK